MFTGIIEEVGSVALIERQGPGGRIVIVSTKCFEDLQLGDSLAVNGACLTVVRTGENKITADLSPETLDRTNLGDLSPGDPVNLERSLAVGDRLGGHWVQGHVDGRAHLVKSAPEGDGYRMTFAPPPELMHEMISKGSVTLDGVSLTIARLGSEDFDVAIIPFSWENTNLSHRKVGEELNLETDLIGKYVARILGSPEARQSMSWETLKEAGFGV